MKLSAALAGTLLAAIGLVAASGSGLAHKDYPIGEEYVGTVGWLSEPPYVDEPNAVLIRLKGHADAPGAVIPEETGHGDAGAHHEEEGMVPLTGHAKNLSVVLKIGGKETKLAFSERHGVPGEYVANTIPTVAGVYNATYTFTIEGEERTIVADIQRADLPSVKAFPEATKSHYELEQLIVKQQQEIASLKQELAAMKSQAASQPTPTVTETKNTPAPAVAFALAALVGVALAARRASK